MSRERDLSYPWPCPWRIRDRIRDRDHGVSVTVSVTITVTVPVPYQPCSECIPGVLETLCTAADCDLDDLAARCLAWVTQNRVIVWADPSFSEITDEYRAWCFQEAATLVSGGDAPPLSGLGGGAADVAETGMGVVLYGLSRARALPMI